VSKLELPEAPWNNAKDNENFLLGAKVMHEKAMIYIRELEAEVERLTSERDLYERKYRLLLQPTTQL